MAHSVEDSKFALHNRKEIVFILEDMSKQRIAINLSTADGVGLVTSVLGVKADANTVFFDISADSRINSKITNSKHVNFATQTGIKVRWYSTHLRLVSLPDGEAFAMNIPAVIERIQRREYFRLNTPQGSKALICKIPVEADILEATIMDMSVEGMCVSIKGDLPEVFSQGALLEGCSIEFLVIGVVPFKLKFCGVWSSIKTKSGEQMHRLGMEFSSLSRGASNVVQRYMIELEKDKINKT